MKTTLLLLHSIKLWSVVIPVLAGLTIISFFIHAANFRNAMRTSFPLGVNTAPLVGRLAGLVFVISLLVLASIVEGLAQQPLTQDGKRMELDFVNPGTGAKVNAKLGDIVDIKLVKPEIDFRGELSSVGDTSITVSLKQYPYRQLVMLSNIRMLSVSTPSPLSRFDNGIVLGDSLVFKRQQASGPSDLILVAENTARGRTHLLKMGMIFKVKTRGSRSFSKGKLVSITTDSIQLYNSALQAIVRVSLKEISEIKIPRSDGRVILGGFVMVAVPLAAIAYDVSQNLASAALSAALTGTGQVDAAEPIPVVPASMWAIVGGIALMEGIHLRTNSGWNFKVADRQTVTSSKWLKQIQAVTVKPSSSR